MIRLESNARSWEGLEQINATTPASYRLGTGEDNVHVGAAFDTRGGSFCLALGGLEGLVESGFVHRRIGRKP